MVMEKGGWDLLLIQMINTLNAAFNKLGARTLEARYRGSKNVTYRLRTTENMKT